jgi:hypothetical protein
MWKVPNSDRKVAPHQRSQVQEKGIAIGARSGVPMLLAPMVVTVWDLMKHGEIRGAGLL